MRNLRLGARLVTGGVYCLLMVALLFLLWPGALVLGKLPRLRSVMTQLWARGLGRVAGMRVTVEGRPPVGATILVTNHLSYMDILLLGGRMPCVFISKAEVGNWPGIGPLSRLAGTLFVDRERRRDVVRVGRAIQGALDQGRAVVFFPEGTSTSGDEVAPFRPSLLEPAASLGIPVHFAALHYRTPPGEIPARLSVAWWGEMELAPHLLQLLRMPYFEARVRFGAAPVNADDRKALGGKLQRSITSIFEPLELPEASAGAGTTANRPPGGALV